MSIEHETLTSLFNDIANAIRSKTGGSAVIQADEFPDAIAAINIHQGVETNKAITITSLSQEVTPSSGYSSMAKVTATVRSAAIIALVGVAVTDVVTVGTESSGYYPISAKIKGNVTVGTSGWYTGSSNLVASSNSQVGKIAKATFAVAGNSVGCSSGGYVTANTTVGTVSNGTATIQNRTSGGTAIAYGKEVSLSEGYYSATKFYNSITSPADLNYTLKSALSISVASKVATVSLAANSYNTSALSLTVDRSTLGITDKASATYNPSTSDQTINSGYYLTGAQTIKGITAITNSTYAGYLTSSTTARTTTIKTIAGPTTSDIYIYPSTSIYNYWANTYGIKISKPTQMNLPTSQNYNSEVGEIIGYLYPEQYETWLNIPAGYNPTPRFYVIEPASSSLMMGTFEIQLGSDQNTREVYPIPVNPATDWLEIIMNTVTFQGWDIGKSGGNIYLDSGPNQGMVLYDAKANIVDASENVIAGEIYYFDWE